MINSFVAEKYWYVNCQVKESKSEIKLNLNWRRGGRFFNQQICNAFKSLLSSSSFATITSVKESVSKRSRPLPLNTVELLKLASTKLRMGPREALETAQRLYIRGLISYPRTESTSYPPSFDFTQIIMMMSCNPHWGEDVQRMIHPHSSSSSTCSSSSTLDCKGGGKKEKRLLGEFKLPKKGVDMGDHSPIFPCRR